MASSNITHYEPDEHVAGSPSIITDTDPFDNQQHTRTASGAGLLGSPIQFDAQQHQDFSSQALPSVDLSYIEASSPARSHSEQDSDKGSFETVDTVILPPRSKITQKAGPKYPLHKQGFNVNGRLARDHPKYKDMAETATQPLTQPAGNQPRGATVSVQDEADIVCILHPSTPAAWQAMELIAETCPQHILQNEGLSRNLDYDLDSFHEEQREDTEQLDTHAPQKARPSTKDIAIRFSSKVNDMSLGWVFGRNASRCDLLLADSDETKPGVTMKISNSHFRIFFNDNGILMLEDVSTNGTWIGRHHLQRKSRQSRRTLHHGDTISILFNSPDDYMRFIVTVPRRDREMAKYTKNVNEYLALVKQYDYRKEMATQAAAQGNGMLPPAVPLAQIRRNAPVSTILARSILAAGQEQFTYGMRWNGGEKYNVVGHVGKGAFADVYKLATKEDGELFAVKEIEKRRFMKEGILTHKAHNEIEVMKNLNHPNIVEYVGYEELPGHLYIIMEFVPYGDLSQYVNEETAMPEYMCRNVAHQMMSALDYLHKSNITHRDIKPDNILIATDDPLKVKLSDFGLSKVIKDNETFMKTFCGTLLYCAPEIYPGYADIKAGLPQRRHRRHNGPEERRNLYQQSVDTWAFAAVMYHLMCGRPPFTGSGEGHGAAMLDTVMSNPVDYSRLIGAGITPEGVDFVQKMLVLEPSERATDAECLAHFWIADLSRAAEADENMQDSEELAAPEEAAPVLDASQLSLQENPAPTVAGDGDEQEHLDADEILQTHRSERVTSGRLFGEIGNSALQSSGVLEPTAYAALGMTMDSSHDGSVSASGEGDGDGRGSSSMGLHNDATGLHVTSNNQVTQHDTNPLHHPRHSNTSLTSGPALSLLGTEVQIGQLNMASPDSAHSMPSTDTNPTTPKLPTSQDQSPSATAVTGSKRVGQDLQSAVEHKAKRVKAHHSSANPRSRRSSAEVSSKQRSASTGGPRVKDPRQSRHGSRPKSQPRQIASGEGAGNDRGQQQRETAQNASTEAVTSHAQETHHQDTTGPGRQAVKERRKGSSNRSNSTSASSVQDTPPTSEFKVPRVPERPTLGKLSVVPGSVSGFVQKAKGAENTIIDRQSKDFNEQLAINLKTRLLYLGRCLEEWVNYGENPKLDYTHITYPYNFDSRVGRKALQIAFWRSGIETAEAAGKDWVRPNDFWATVSSESKAAIYINGVRLEQGKDRFLFGKLYTGDIITLFDEQKPGNPAGFLKLECEFYRGLSKQRRPEGVPFTIEEEIDKFRKSRESSIASSKPAATAPATTTTEPAT